MQRYVEISFDCLPLRSISRMEVPLDASPRYRQRCENIKAAMEAYGSYNSYYLYNAHCVFHLTNSADEGMLEFSFEGTILTDGTDQTAATAHLEIKLQKETCEWLTEPVVAWFKDTVPRAVMVEFNRYIAAGDLEQAKKRIAAMQAKADQSGGYMGMYL
jgi:hypothetical protein